MLWHYYRPRHCPPPAPQELYARFQACRAASRQLQGERQAEGGDKDGDAGVRWVLGQLLLGGGGGSGDAPMQSTGLAARLVLRDALAAMGQQLSAAEVAAMTEEEVADRVAASLVLLQVGGWRGVEGGGVGGWGWWRGGRWGTDQR